MEEAIIVACGGAAGRKWGRIAGAGMGRRIRGRLESEGVVWIERGGLHAVR